MLTPKYLFKDVTHITPAFLRRHGIRALALDVDNTLTSHGSQEIAPEILAWLEGMKAEGFPMMIASNNTEQRVAPFARQLGLEHASFCCKPSPVWLAKALKKWGLRRSEVALVGDQVFTDMLAGHLYGVKVLMVRPMYEDPKPTIRFKRKLEKPFLMRYYRRGGRLL